MSNKSVKVFLSVIVAVVILAGAVAVGNTVINGRQPDAVPAGATVAETQAPESTTAAAQPVTLSFFVGRGQPDPRRDLRAGQSPRGREWL